MSMVAHLVQSILKPQRPVSQLREIFRAQVACALRELEGSGNAVPTSVHAARKQLKKARATLRLLRPSLGDAVYQRENITLRDVARPLSGFRDSEVLLATFEKLTSRVANHQPATNLDSIRTALTHRIRQIANSQNINTDEIALLRQTLSSARRRVSRWALRADDWTTVLVGLRRTYRNGRSAIEIARRMPTTEHLHDWRKQTKYLWHQLQILTPIAPGKLGELADQFHRLSDYLGDEHDLAGLEATIAPVNIDLQHRESAMFNREIDQRRTQLREKAFALGERLYSSKTRRFMRRMEVLCETWRNVTARRPKTSQHTQQS